MFTILAAHVGLAIGTLSRYLKQRPDLKPLVNRLLRFDTVGIYLLTERGHGLDALNIETTAIKTNEGYILHTPREEAAKFVSTHVMLLSLTSCLDSCQLLPHLLEFLRSRWSWLVSLWTVKTGVADSLLYRYAMSMRCFAGSSPSGFLLAVGPHRLISLSHVSIMSIYLLLPLSARISLVQRRLPSHWRPGGTKYGEFNWVPWPSLHRGYQPLRLSPISEVAIQCIDA